MKDFTLESPIANYDLDESLQNLTLPEYLLQSAQKVCQSENGRTKDYIPFIIDTVTNVSNDFASFDDKTGKIASALYKRGMRRYDTAIFMTSDLVDLHFFFAGVWRANGRVRASYPEDDAETLLGRVEESRVGWILCDPNTAEMCLSIAEKVYWGVEIIVVGKYDGCTSLSEFFEDEGDEIPDVQITPDDIAMILCTSGTTGKSKGAVHKHRNLVRIIEAMGTFWPFSAEKPNLMISKGTHITGAVFPFVAFATGKTILVMPTITKENLFKAVQDYKPGFIWGFPTFLLALVNDPDAANYDLTSLEIAASGGAAVTPTIESALMQLLNLKCVINAYGLTEIVPIAASINYGSEIQGKFPDSPPFTVGKVFPGITVQIRDIDTNIPLGPNEKGEIHVKSTYLFNGYYQNEKATNEAIIDGWFKTGDIGYYDENEFLFMVDRMKEIFKYYNNHISPTELEEVICQHPAVAECCVIGVSDPDGGDSIPRAFVTLKDESTCSANEICSFANGKVPDYKKLRGGLFILAELPKGKTGKITRQLAATLELPEE